MSTTSNGLLTTLRAVRLFGSATKPFMIGLILSWASLASIESAVAETETPATEAVLDQHREQCDRMAAQLLQIFDVVLQEHREPSTRQEMVLGAIEQAYKLRSRVMPASLPMQVSDANSIDQLHELLAKELAGLSVPPSGNPFKHLPHALHELGVQLTPLKTQRVNEQMAANRYVGIGIAITKSGNYPTMAKIMPGGAASNAECQSGDEIVRVGERDTSGLPLETVIDWLRGPEGTDVNVHIRRNGKDQSLTMTRSIVPMKTIGEPVYSQSRSIAGVAIERVSASNVHELRKFSNSLEETVNIVVLDIRTSQNATHLHYGKLLGNALIDDQDMGQVIDRDGNASTIHTEPGTLFPGRDLHLLIGQRTGPVLKWVAAAVQDTNTGSLIGLPATAPCVVSKVIDIPDISLAVTMPTHQLARANGLSLTPTGVIANANPTIRPMVNPLGREGSLEGVVYPEELMDGRKMSFRDRSRGIVAMKPIDLPLQTAVQQLDDERRKSEGDENR